MFCEVGSASPPSDLNWKVELLLFKGSALCGLVTLLRVVWPHGSSWCLGRKEPVYMLICGMGPIKGFVSSHAVCRTSRGCKKEKRYLRGVGGPLVPASLLGSGEAGSKDLSASSSSFGTHLRKHQ